MTQKLSLPFKVYLLAPLAFSFVVGLSLAGPAYGGVSKPSTVSMVEVISNPLNYQREEYLKALAELAKNGVSAEIYNAGGRKNVRDDGHGHVLTQNHGMKISYNENLPRVLAILSTYPENFKDLLVDQGILNHADEFVAFLQKCVDCKTKDPWEVRRLASKAIGTQTVYRGVFVSDEAAKQIKHNGFMARAFSNPSQPNALIAQLTETTESQINIHVKDTAKSPFMSVSDHPEVSIAVSRKFAGENKTGRSVYLFKLQIPKLDLVHSSEFDTATWPEEREETKELYGFYVVGENDKVLLFANGPDLESLVPFRIMPSEIVGMKKISDQDSPYRAYKPEGMID